jgi:hypothetical protein
MRLVFLILTILLLPEPASAREGSGFEYRPKVAHKGPTYERDVKRCQAAAADRSKDKMHLEQGGYVQYGDDNELFIQACMEKKGYTINE